MTTATKIATWNVNSIRVRLPRLLAWLAAHKPDVLCLQEIKVEDALFPLADLEAAGYQAAVFGQKTYNGVAILSRSPATDIVRGFGDGVEDAQSRFIAATVAGVRVASLYVPNGQAVGTEKYAYKLAWFERWRAWLSAHVDPGQPFAFCGDFNVAPEDRDVHDPIEWKDQVLCSVPERQALEQVRAWGLQDVFRRHVQDAGVYSWWDYRMLGFPKNRGLRIDHIYATPPLAEKSIGASVDRNERKGKEASDHAPVIAEFQI